MIPPSDPTCEDFQAHRPEICESPTSQGMCVGVGEKVGCFRSFMFFQFERRMLEAAGQDQIEASINMTGFHVKKPEEIHPNQIMHMQARI